MAFPTSNLQLSTVCAAYGVNPASMSGLRGKTYYNSSGTPSTVPTTESYGLLATFGGNYSVYQEPVTETITSLPIIPPSGKPTPTGFSMTLLGGGGGGGGGSYGSTLSRGGPGGGGGGGATIQTGRLPYNSVEVANIQITFPTAGGGGLGALFLPNNGAPGGSGGSAILVYLNKQYVVGGGGGGGGGIWSSSAAGASGAGGEGSVSPPDLSVTITNGSSGSGINGGAPNGGYAGDGGAGDFFSGGNPGFSGVAGGAGTVTITWYFT